MPRLHLAGFLGEAPSPAKHAHLPGDSGPGASPAPSTRHLLQSGGLGCSSLTPTRYSGQGYLEAVPFALFGCLLPALTGEGAEAGQWLLVPTPTDAWQPVGRRPVGGAREGGSGHSGTGCQGEGPRTLGQTRLTSPENRELCAERDRGPPPTPAADDFKSPVRQAPFTHSHGRHSG